MALRFGPVPGALFLVGIDTHKDSMAKRTSDPWRITWRFATSDMALVVLLLGLAVGVIATAWIPQRPSSDPDYARWLSQVQARFGGATSLMGLLGLFNVTGSFGFRALLACLSACLVLRLVEKVDHIRRFRQAKEPEGNWQEISGAGLGELLDWLGRRRYRIVEGSAYFQIDRWPWVDAFVVMAHSGALLLLAGLLLSHLWGWQVQGVVLQRGQRISLTGGDHWVALGPAGSDVRHSPGVIAWVEERGPGVRVQAFAADGQELGLQLTVEAEPSTELALALTEDGYFAVPEANLIVRLTPRSRSPFTRLDVQIYRSPPGEIIAEAVTEEGGEAEVTVEDVALRLTPAPYVELTASQNPGRWLAGLGLFLLVGGLVANTAWPADRFWLREREAFIEANGPLPPMPVAVEEKT